jgi:KipI family sensor histidine kinase inhibitor
MGAPHRDRESTRRLRWCGDSGLLVELTDLQSVQEFYDAVLRRPPPGTRDIIPAARTVLVKIDPIAQHREVEEHLAGLPAPPLASTGHTELVEVPVVYDGADLPVVAELAHLSAAEVKTMHTGTTWQVAFCGFAPGFAYLSGGDPRLAVPRRGESRTRVPPGAVALAGGFSAVYPRESPGGWQLIGHTDLTLWDTDADPPSPLRPGVTVRFVDVGA